MPGQLAGLDLRHRQHARVEDRIRQGKETELRNLLCDLARCEIATFRYRVLHVAARITRGARQIRVRLDTTWRWALAIADAWAQIRAAFT